MKVRGVNGQNYMAKCKDYIKFHNLEELPMIHPELDAEQWNQWRDYFEQKRIPFGYMDACREQTRRYCVPSDWPGQFDQDYLDKIEQGNVTDGYQD